MVNLSMLFFSCFYSMESHNHLSWFFGQSAGYVNEVFLKTNYVLAKFILNNILKD